MITVKARCACPRHGKLNLDDIIIRNNIPVCSKCLSALEFATVRPRKVRSK